MTQAFLHGIDFKELSDGIRPVSLNDRAVGGFLVTAPDADPLIWPLDTPVLLTSAPRLAFTLGLAGTALGAVRDFYAAGGGSCVVVRVAQGATPALTMAAMVGDAGLKTGAYAFLAARALCGVVPRTLMAPGYTSQRPLTAAIPPVPGPNPVVAALLLVAKRLRGRVYFTAPSTSRADALAARNDWGDGRLTIFYPSVEVFDAEAGAYVTRAGDATAAGLLAQVHRDHGIQFSPSNFTINSLGGTAVPIDYAPGDPDSEANILNANQIVTFIQDNGWRRWGNATCAADPLWRFEVVRTVTDAIYDALDAETRWAVDKPPSRQLLIDVTASANQFFKRLKYDGVIVGGRCWLDPERNTPQQLQQGIWAWDIDPEAPAPMEHITYYAHRNANYYADEVASLAALVASTN